MNNETNIKVLKGQFFILAVILTGKKKGISQKTQSQP